MSNLATPQWKVQSTDLGDGIRQVTLNNPPVNALSFALCAELFAAVDEAEHDAAVTTVVFAGSNGFFSGGADVNDLNNLKAAPPPGTKTIRRSTATRSAAGSSSRSPPTTASRRRSRGSDSPRSSSACCRAPAGRSVCRG